MLERRVANLRTRLAPATPPIFVSEFGANLTTEAHVLAGTLTMLKALGIHAASHFTLQDYGTAFADRGLLNSTGLIGEQGTVWKIWHQTVGIAAAFGARETIGSLSNVRCYRFTRQRCDDPGDLGEPGDAVDQRHRHPHGQGCLRGHDHCQRPRTPWVLAVADLYRPDQPVTVAPAASQETLLAYPEIDFSTTQGLNGWTYQSFTGSTYTNAQADAVNDRWTIPTSGVWLITPTIGHPTSAGATAAVRKWTVPAGVTRVRVTGTWARGAGGDGSDVTLLHNRHHTIRFRRAVLLQCDRDHQPDFQRGGWRHARVPGRAGTRHQRHFDTTVLHALIYSTTAAVNWCGHRLTTGSGS